MENSRTLEKELKEIQGRIRGAEKELQNYRVDQTERDNLQKQLQGMIEYEKALWVRVEDAKKREQK